jgi:predicted Zn-dependent protease
MNNENIFYYDGSSARPHEVRVLVFNDALNLYEAESNDFITSYPLRGANSTRTGGNYFIYIDPSGTKYLQISAHHAMAETIVKEVSQANETWVKKLMRQKIIVLFALMIALVIGFYVLLVTLIPVIGTAMISRDMEISLGNKLKQMMISEEEMMGSDEDRTATVKLQAFADRIKLSNGYPIRVTVLNSDIVNAYALPGGQIVVYTGMLDKISDAESLAALLAHEASHVNHRHTLKSLMRSAANGLLVSIVFNDATGISATLISNAETLRGLEYSRAIETEADEKGMELMLSNNIDPEGMKRLMNLLAAEGDVPESISFLSSHPLTKKRIKAADNFIRKHPGTGNTRADLASAFKELKKER